MVSAARIAAEHVSWAPHKASQAGDRACESRISYVKSDLIKRFYTQLVRNFSLRMMLMLLVLSRYVKPSINGIFLAGLCCTLRPLAPLMFTEFAIKPTKG